ncbi:apolipoprotein L2-like [Grammomys surdaster]|uniref:apolipoprotein L2-like n=1 Tax=Grammomys surdaster TaxID=491861 RepID=UPI0010A010C7|nr:apolipoprotein L2-like [Grammomys surdaster]
MKADVQTLCTASWRSTMININRTQEVAVLLRLQVRKEELNRAHEHRFSHCPTGGGQGSGQRSTLAVCLLSVRAAWSTGLECWKMLVVESGIGVVKTEGHSSRRDVLDEGKEDDALSEALGETVADADAGDEEELSDADAEDEGELADADAEDEEELADTDAEDEEKIQSDLWHKQRFLDVYPQVKLELEERIRKLHALADKVDKVHRDCTISQVVASSSSAVSGVLTILGLTLAPVTAGVSLALSATGLGLGTAAAVTSVSTSIVEKVSVVSAEAEASKLVPTNKDTVKDMKDVLGLSGPRLVSLSKNSFKNLENIKKNIHAIKLAKANPRLANNAKCLMTTGKTSTETTKQVQKAFGGTALAMTKGARITGAATAGLFLLLDVISLVQDSKHLHDGAKAESAAELRQQALDLQQKLQELKQVHDTLIQ